MHAGPMSTRFPLLGVCLNFHARPLTFCIFAMLRLPPGPGSAVLTDRVTATNGLPRSWPASNRSKDAELVAAQYRVDGHEKSGSLFSVSRQRSHRSCFAHSDFLDRGHQHLPRRFAGTQHPRHGVNATEKPSKSPRITVPRLLPFHHVILLLALHSADADDKREE